MCDSALLIGRFQPPHNGHKKIINLLLKKYKRLTIAIGSSNQKRSQKNPLSAKERLFLLKKLLAKNKDVRFAFIPDNPSNDKWANYVYSRFFSKDTIVISANPLVRKLLKNKNFKLDSSPLFNRLEWEGSKIRNLIRQRKPYLSKIPKEIHSLVEKKKKFIQD